MTPERLYSILDKVHNNYIGRRLSPQMVKEFYDEVSAVIRGLHKTEHFLNVFIDTKGKVILCRDEETLTFLSFLPYLDNRLMEDNELYIVYLVKDDKYASMQCGIEFKDLYNQSTDDSDIGFSINLHPIFTLGAFYPNTNEFRVWEE